MTIIALKYWVKNDSGKIAKILKNIYFSIRHFQIPSVPVIYKSVHELHMLVNHSLSWLARVFYWTPIFQTYLVTPAKRLYIYCGMPQVIGNIELFIGDDCRISGHTTFSGRNANGNRPRLSIGNNVGIGWQTTIAVGRNIVIGDNARIAGRCFLAGYPGHPMDVKDRAAGLPDTEDQVGDIILDNDVWLGTNVTVNAGVTIGAGSVVASGSVVTKDIPPGVLAAGVPAKIIRQL